MLLGKSVRKFLNLNKNRQVELDKKFPDLFKIYCVEDSPHYKKVAITVFDHWLTREEFENDFPDKTERLRRDKSLHDFAKVMSKNTEVLNFKFKGKWERCYPSFRKFSSQAAMDIYLHPAGDNDSSDKFCRLVLPEFSAVYFESWDYTNIFYIQDDKVIPQIKKWANESGVYCLEY